jgi:hypothetical protein
MILELLFTLCVLEEYALAYDSISSALVLSCSWSGVLVLPSTYLVLDVMDCTAPHCTVLLGSTSRQPSTGNGDGSGSRS